MKKAISALIIFSVISGCSSMKSTYDSVFGSEAEPERRSPALNRSNPNLPIDAFEASAASPLAPVEMSIPIPPPPSLAVPKPEQLALNMPILPEPEQFQQLPAELVPQLPQEMPVISQPVMPLASVPTPTEFPKLASIPQAPAVQPEISQNIRVQDLKSELEKSQMQAGITPEPMPEVIQQPQYIPTQIAQPIAQPARLIAPTQGKTVVVRSKKSAGQNLAMFQPSSPSIPQPPLAFDAITMPQAPIISKPQPIAPQAVNSYFAPMPKERVVEEAFAPSVSSYDNPEYSHNAQAFTYTPQSYAPKTKRLKSSRYENYRKTGKK